MLEGKWSATREFQILTKTPGIKTRCLKIIDFQKLQGTLVYLMNTRRYSPLRGLTSSSCKGPWPSAKTLLDLKVQEVPKGPRGT